MTMRALVPAIFLLSACGTGATAPKASLDPIATDFVKMTLEIGEREEGYVDAYYGPAEWAAAAKAKPRTVPELRAEADRLTKQLDAVGKLDELSERRRAFLRGQLRAATTRMRMMQGEKLGFADEAEGLFGIRPELKPLSSYDPILARIEQLVPGEGALGDRVDRFQQRFDIPKDRMKPVFDAAIAECKRRTLEHIKLPANESFTLEFVTGKSWGGYNYYKGNAHSLIQVNTDLPVRISRAIDLGCHEGYPGHHVYNALLEEKLTKGQKWVEFSIYPLYSPQSFLAEGSANYGIELAFPGNDQLTYERAKLYPLARLNPVDAGRYLEVAKLAKDLAGARFTIAADYLEGRITRDQAVALTQKYQLTSKERAEKSMEFTDQYRSYIINYGLGLDMVRAYVEAAGPDQKARWARMEKILSEPTVPGDLAAR